MRWLSGQERRLHVQLCPLPEMALGCVSVAQSATSGQGGSVRASGGHVSPYEGPGLGGGTPAICLSLPPRPSSAGAAPLCHLPLALELAVAAVWAPVWLTGPPCSLSRSALPWGRWPLCPSSAPPCPLHLSVPPGCPSLRGHSPSLGLGPCEGQPAPGQPS